MCILIVFSVCTIQAFALSDLERVQVDGPKFTNIFGHHQEEIEMDQQVQIISDIKNMQNKPQDFVYIVQIRDESGFVIAFNTFSAQLAANQQMVPGVSWTPTEGGQYTIDVYIWEKIIVNKSSIIYEALAPSVSTTTNVD